MDCMEIEYISSTGLDIQQCTLEIFNANNQATKGNESIFFCVEEILNKMPNDENVHTQLNDTDLVVCLNQ